jgi:hypothetical protein
MTTRQGMYRSVDAETGIVWSLVDLETAAHVKAIEATHGAAGMSLETLRESAALVQAANDRLAAEVALARKNGITWDAIGQALGVTRQAAWQRFRSS